MRRLFRGRWDYLERGILNHGHLRFFTLHTIRSLFAQVGLKLEYVGRNRSRAEGDKRTVPETHGEWQEGQHFGK